MPSHSHGKSVILGAPIAVLQALKEVSWKRISAETPHTAAGWRQILILELSSINSMQIKQELFITLSKSRKRPLGQ